MSTTTIKYESDSNARLLHHWVKVAREAEKKEALAAARKMSSQQRIMEPIIKKLKTNNARVMKKEDVKVPVEGEWEMVGEIQGEADWEMVGVDGEIEGNQEKELVDEDSDWEKVTKEEANDRKEAYGEQTGSRMSSISGGLH